MPRLKWLGCRYLLVVHTDNAFCKHELYQQLDTGLSDDIVSGPVRVLLFKSMGNEFLPFPSAFQIYQLGQYIGLPGA